MAIVLALVTAAMYGVADFAGGLATRRDSVLAVVVGAHVIGAAGVLAASLLVAEALVVGDLVLGALGGLGGLVGVLLLYRRLAIGPMSVVAPLTAITSAVVPALWGLWLGERLGILAWVGVTVGLAAIALVSLVDDGLGDRAPVTPRVVVESLLAGAGFGVFFVFLDGTDPASAPWPVVAARVLTSVVLAGVMVTVWFRQGRPAVRLPGRAQLGLIAVAGLADTGANVAFLFATTSESGQLAVISVLASLYPVSTVILAWIVLGERMTRPQGVGFGAAMAATVLLAVG